MMRGIPTPAARPAPATTEPFRNSRRVTAMTSPFDCRRGGFAEPPPPDVRAKAALQPLPRRLHCRAQLRTTLSVSAEAECKRRTEAPSKKFSLLRLECGSGDCLFRGHVACDRLRHKQGPGYLSHGAPAVH